MTEPAFIDGLQLKRLRKTVGDFTLEADFSLARADRAVLAAESGMGKTTLLRVIAGLEIQDSGEIWLGGKALHFLQAERRGIGYVFQEQVLFPSMSVWENVAYGLRLRGVPHGERKAQALGWLEKLGLGSRAESGVGTLSGGERQRVALARAWIWKPDLLLMDEPFSALHSQMRDQLRRELVSLHQEFPVPMIVVTHDERDLRELATVRLGIEAAGDCRYLVERPAPSR